MCKVLNGVQSPQACPLSPKPGKTHNEALQKDRCIRALLLRTLWGALYPWNKLLHLSMPSFLQKEFTPRKWLRSYTLAWQV